MAISEVELDQRRCCLIPMIVERVYMHKQIDLWDMGRLAELLDRVVRSNSVNLENQAVWNV